MKIGIVSDSHGRVDRLRCAMTELLSRDAEVIIHCGDLGSAACIEALGSAPEAVAVYAVAGNTDRNITELIATASLAAVNFDPESIEVPLSDGRHLAATHGDDHDVLLQLITAGRFAYVCHGHTHRAEDVDKSGVRVICPGALAHPKSPRHPTAALLDTQTESLDLITIE